MNFIMRTMMLLWLNEFDENRQTTGKTMRLILIERYYMFKQKLKENKENKNIKKYQFHYYTIIIETLIN